MSGYGRRLEHDGLYTPEVGPWATQKLDLHYCFTELFSTSMKDVWDQRAYIGLYCGPGRARIRETREIIETSAISALRVPHPFDKYVFCDSNPAVIEALQERVRRLDGQFDVSYLPRDVNESAGEIRSKLPPFGKGHTLLTFCFVDSFAADLHFSCIRALADGLAIDFLILLALGHDARRNLKLYLQPESTRIAELVDDPGWRKDWQIAEKRGSKVIPYLAEKFRDKMVELGYEHTPLSDMFEVRSARKNLHLYLLAFFSRHPLGIRFWRETRKTTSRQLSLGI